MKAAWITDYDYQHDKCYKRPGCPDCMVPIYDKEDDGSYWCNYCEKEMELTPEMIKWIEDREGIKQEMTDCPFCGGKGCYQRSYIKDNITLKWRVISGECEKCDVRMMV